MHKVLMIGPSKQEKGGMSTVIQNFTQCDQFETFFFNNWQSNGWILLFLRNILTIRRFIKKNDIDIVHFHVAQDGSFFRKSILLFVIPKNIPTIFHMHASHFDKFYSGSQGYKKKWINKTLNRVDSIVAVSEQWKEYYESITTTLVTYINNSVLIQKESCFNPTNKRVITLGRIGKRKGSYDILTAARMIAKIDPDVTFEFYGDGSLQEFRNLSKDLPNVTIHDWIPFDDFKKELKGTTLHLLPSYSEGLPMAVLETMMLGIPNITSDVGGLASVIIPRNTGWLVKAGSSEQIVNCILYAVNHPQELSIISENSKKMITDQFSVKNYFSFWVGQYQKMVLE